MFYFLSNDNEHTVVSFYLQSVDVCRNYVYTTVFRYT